MDGVSFDTIINKALQMGDGKFEQGTINVAAGATVKAGTVLKRGVGKKFVKATGGDTVLIAVVPFDLTNTSNASADLGFRALIGGSVRMAALNFDGAAITDAQGDTLRDYGIIAVSSTDMSRVNP